MDLVSFDTPGEFAMFAEIMNRGGWKQHRMSSAILLSHPSLPSIGGFNSNGREVEIWNANSLRQCL